MSPLAELYLQSFPASLFLLQNDVLTFFQEFPQILLLKLALADIQIPHTELPALHTQTHHSLIKSLPLLNIFFQIYVGKDQVRKSLAYGYP